MSFTYQFYYVEPGTNAIMILVPVEDELTIPEFHSTTTEYQKYVAAEFNRLVALDPRRPLLLVISNPGLSSARVVAAEIVRDVLHTKRPRQLEWLWRPLADEIASKSGQT